MTSTPTFEATVQDLSTVLGDRAQAEAPHRFPINRLAASRPGLYSWWADGEARKQLGSVLRTPMPPLIYIGQAGATQWPSGRRPQSTLVSRIRSGHINGNASASTFRLTISAILRGPMNLRVEKPRRLVPGDNRRVTAWIKEHLRVVIAPYDDRDSLGRVEEAVLVKVDPPLNLEGMPYTPLRDRLAQLRKRISQAGRAEVSEAVG